eukprot:5237047-Amphidinium_carterae.2
MALNKGVPAVPETLEFARFLAYNASDTVCCNMKRITVIICIIGNKVLILDPRSCPPETRNSAQNSCHEHYSLEKALSVKSQVARLATTGAFLPTDMGRWLCVKMKAVADCIWY